MTIKYQLESDVDDYVKSSLNSLGLVKLKDYNEKSSMSDYMKESLRGSAKTQTKTNFGVPDFNIEKYNIPVIIENKLSNNKHEASSSLGIKMDDNSIKYYAVNGAIYYAKNMIASKKYNEVIAIGITGESEEEIRNAGHAISVCGGSAPETIRYSLGDMSRSLVFISKEKSTPRVYPRKAGIPSKTPL